jgi:hypothetical protein
MPTKDIRLPAKTCLLLLLSFALLSVAYPQSTSKNDKQEAQRTKIKDLVDSQRYTFEAEMVMPARGRSRPLTGDSYDLQIGKTAIVSYLPYFGEAYSAPLDPTRAGIQFTSKKFHYTAIPKKDGGWNVIIKTDDLQDDWQLSLSISVDGYASLQVNGGNRQSITFTGRIAAPKMKSS